MPAETIDGQLHQNFYDKMGQLTTQTSPNDQAEFPRNSWRRLTQIRGKMCTWEATYDAFGRCLKPFTIPKRDTLQTTSFYDPQEEFQGIGLQVNQKTYWKIYANESCEVILDEIGKTLNLLHDILGNLIRLVTLDKIHRITGQPYICGQSSVKLAANHYLFAFAALMLGKASTPIRQA